MGQTSNRQSKYFNNLISHTPKLASPVCILIHLPLAELHAFTLLPRQKHWHSLKPLRAMLVKYVDCFLSFKHSLRK